MHINLTQFVAVMQFAWLDTRKIILLFEIVGVLDGEIEALHTHRINTLLKPLQKPMELYYEID